MGEEPKEITLNRFKSFGSIFLGSILFKTTAIYVISNSINRSIPFLLLPILTRYLSKAEYGILATIQVMIAFIYPAIGLSTGGAVSRAYWDLSKKRLAIYVGEVLKIALFSFVFVMITIILLKSYLERILNVPGNWILLIPIITFSTFLITINLGLWQMEKKALNYGIFQIFLTCTTFILSLFFVIVLNWNWKGHFISLFSNAVIFAIVSTKLLYNRGYLSLSKNKSFSIDALKFGIPIMPHEWGAIIITQSGLLFINALIGISSAGSYAVGFSFAQIISLINRSVNQAWVPFLFERLKRNDFMTKIRIVRFTYLYFIGIILFAIFIGLFSPFIFKILIGKEFRGNLSFIIYIALAFAFNGMYLMISGYIYYVKKTHILARITFLSAILNLASNYYLIKINGVLGSAQAMLLSSIFNFLGTWWYSSREIKMPWLKAIKVLYVSK